MSILEVNNLSFEVKGETRIHNASFVINSGDVVLLSGPNGSGKSTIVKILMGDLFDYDESMNYSASSLLYYENNEAIDISSEKGKETFRKKVCYISQNDDLAAETLFDCFMLSIGYSDIDNKARSVFDFAREYSIQDCFILNSNHELNGKEKKIAKQIGVSESELSENDKKIIKVLALKIKQMSGGQRKLSNIITNLIRVSFSDLIILDEPLNNLDYNNVRAFSNTLTRIYRNNNSIGIIVVTHCRSLPIINRVLEIKPSEKTLVSGSIHACNSCFGEINADGLYI